MPTILSCVVMLRTIVILYDDATKPLTGSTSKKMPTANAHMPLLHAQVHAQHAKPTGDV